LGNPDRPIFFGMRLHPGGILAISRWLIPRSGRYHRSQLGIRIASRRDASAVALLPSLPSSLRYAVTCATTWATVFEGVIVPHYLLALRLKQVTEQPVQPTPQPVPPIPKRCCGVSVSGEAPPLDSVAARRTLSVWAVREAREKRSHRQAT